MSNRIKLTHELYGKPKYYGTQLTTLGYISLLVYLAVVSKNYN